MMNIFKIKRRKRLFTLAASIITSKVLMGNFGSYIYLTNSKWSKSWGQTALLFLRNSINTLIGRPAQLTHSASGRERI